MKGTLGIGKAALWVAAVAAAVALGFALHGYLTPLTGITGTTGALLASIGAALVFGAAVLLALASLPRWLVLILVALVLLGALGTGVADHFLMLSGAAIAMIVTFLAVIVASVAGRRGVRA